jgi:beta-galactosidase
MKPARSIGFLLSLLLVNFGLAQENKSSISTNVESSGNGLSVSATALAVVSPRERLNFNDNWRFQKDDPVEAQGKLDYQKIKNWLLPTSARFRKNAAENLQQPAGNLGEDIPFTQAGFDDSGWRKLALPHDWAIEGPFQQALPGATGKLPWVGASWYRKRFVLPATDAGRQISLDVDGAMSYAMVWCNGHFVGGWPYGYASFRLELTHWLQPGKTNVLAIRLNNLEQSSRWYPGAGLYRNVWLVKSAPVRVAQWGTYVTTPEVSSNSATVKIQTQGEGATAATKVGTEIFEWNADRNRLGRSVARLIAEEAPLPDASGLQTSQLKISHPKLWSCESPQLYVAVTTLIHGGKIVDRYETPFGIRTLQFTADDGFLLNGQRVQLKGVCNHHDLGALGAAFNLRAAERQLEILKEMGGNALRTSHNPPAPELLDLCDRMGILVMDESFDCWKRGKRPNDYNLLWDDWHEADLRAEIRRDRNHPSVILWSIGNEVLELGRPDEGRPIASELTAIAHEEDPTRPTVLGSNNRDAGFNGVQTNVDVFGQNYQKSGYAAFKAKNPRIPVVGSETSSTVSSRGEYFFLERPEENAALQTTNSKASLPFSPVSEDKGQGKSDFQVSSYDLYGPGWAITPDKEFMALEKNRFVLGEFVWTGFDYLGEPTPYNNDTSNLLNFQDAAGRAEMARQLKELGKILVPSRSSYFGIVDLAGFKKDRFYLYQAHWRPNFPMAHIMPHWNWSERVGQVTPVQVYTSGDESELFLNGKSQGRKKKNAFEYRLRWNDVVYEPGELKVVAYRQGKTWAEEVVRTTGPAAKLLLQPDRKVIKASADDLAFITVTVADKSGLLVPRSKNHLRFELAGPGEIVAVDNGDATSFEPFQASERNAWNGLALVIVRGIKPGKIELKATSDGLQPAVTTLEAR